MDLAHSRSLLLLSLLVSGLAAGGCLSPDARDWGKDGDDGGGPVVDADGDGFPADVDCDDDDPTVYPGANEYCNGKDNDCNGVVDDDYAQDALRWYRDADDDGFGDVNERVSQCSQPEGYVEDATDCDDDDPAVYPGADERCDGRDNDCNGVVDDDYAVDAPTWYRDADRDGFGDASSSTISCSAPAGYVASSTDCDDTDGTVYPGAYEYCNGVDNDCNGVVDDDYAQDALTWYRDSDGDGFGDPSSRTRTCEQPAGYVADNTDCDDASAAIYPGADERCNGVDDDCNGVVDDDYAIDATTWYLDADGDGYGDSSTTADACSVPTGYVADDTDCDDTDATIHPGAEELCDGVDRDCNGIVDDGCDIEQIEGGGYHSLGLRNDGVVLAWGRNNQGQLGDGTTAQAYLPVETGLSGTATQVAAGLYHSLALIDDGTVMAWGNNTYGQLGNGTRVSSHHPVGVRGVSGAVAVAAGDNHSLALIDDGTVMAWGHNSRGQLGDGSEVDSTTALTVVSVTTAVDVAGGAYHSLALLDDGTVQAWGLNLTGQLGDGSATSSSTPVLVSGVSTAVAVAAGGYHSLCVLLGGTVQAWGLNIYGQLGDGTETNAYTPVTASSISTGAEVAGGLYHSLALLSDGTVMGWGYNFYGQVGDGTNVDSSTPAWVTSSVDDIAAGYTHSLAVVNDGTSVAWGQGSHGRLGDGTGYDYTRPVTISYP